MSTLNSQNLNINLGAVPVQVYNATTPQLPSTAGTGIVIAKNSTNSTSLLADGSTAGDFIAPNCQYSQIATSTITNYAYTLPYNPIVGQIYTIRNDGATTVSLFPGTTNSTINAIGGSAGAGNPVYIGGNGGVISLICDSNNGAVNTAVGAAYNNPLSVFHEIATALITGSDIVSIAQPTAAQLALTPNQSGTVYSLGTNTSANTYTLPAVAVSAGVNYTFVRNVNASGFAITIHAASAVVYGNIIGNVATTVANNVILTAQTNIIFTATTGLIGDRVYIFSDGVNWYATAFTTLSGAVAGAFTSS